MSMSHEGCNYTTPTGRSRVENGRTYYEYRCACGDTAWF